MAKAEAKGKAVKSNWVDIEFLQDFGSYKKGDINTYHTSTITKLISGDKPIAKVTKELTKYVPKKAVL